MPIRLSDLLLPCLLLGFCSACDDEPGRSTNLDAATHGGDAAIGRSDGATSGGDAASWVGDAAIEPSDGRAPDMMEPADAGETAADGAVGPAPLLPARIGIGGLVAPGNVAVMAERGGLEWSVLRPLRRADGALDVDRILAEVDCLVLPGGDDIDPAMYGEEPHPTVRLISSARAEFDFAVLQGALDRRMPVLALCLGAQELNVLLGGTLVQDIPSQVPGALDHRRAHTIQVVPGTLMATLYDRAEFEIHSNHHQSAADGEGLGAGLRVSARSVDGVVEALEAEDREAFPFLFGTQYHPEHQLDSGLHDGMIAGLKRACLAYQATRPRPPTPPDHGDVQDSGPCHSDLGPGVCLDVAECAAGGGAAAPGLCAGPANVQCCVGVMCANASDEEGECFSADLCDQLGRDRERFLCPGNHEVQCCFLPTACQLRDGTPGTCRGTDDCDQAGGRREPDHCPGPAHIQCCVDP